MKKMGEREKKYVHMLNATLCATGRAICCLLETYQVRTALFRAIRDHASISVELNFNARIRINSYLL
jgi:seryl-tRNA synthetase